MASCTFPGRSQHSLSSRQCTSLSVRRHSWPVPVPPFISVMHQPPQCGAIPGRFQCTLSSRKYSSPSLRHSSCQFPVHDARRHGTNLTALAEMNSPAGTAPCTSLAYMSSPAGTAPWWSLPQMRSTWAARLTDLYDYAPADGRSVATPALLLHRTASDLAFLDSCGGGCLRLCRALAMAMAVASQMHSRGDVKSKALYNVSSVLLPATVLCPCRAACHYPVRCFCLQGMSSPWDRHVNAPRPVPALLGAHWH